MLWDNFKLEVRDKTIDHCKKLANSKKNEIKKLKNELKYLEELSNTSTYKEDRSLKQPEALKSLYRSPGYKKNQLVLCKTMSCSGSHLGITINIKNTKFVKDLPMIDAQFRFNQCNSFREEYISVFSPYGSVLIL